ncbi:MAG: hypothetical protein GEU94_21060 [Micromonosporaceae bacterium]|nr:hypothetical protein [Micromonosporaceae bacterium]
MEFTSDFTPGPGGVMTAEVGVVTGDLTLRTEVSDTGALTLRVQYQGADEWYAVAGGEGSLPDPAAAGAVHQLMVSVLSRGGPVPPGSEGWTPETA